MYRYATENYEEKKPNPIAPRLVSVAWMNFSQMKKAKITDCQNVAQLTTWLQHEAWEKWKTTEIIEVLVQIYFKETGGPSNDEQ